MSLRGKLALLFAAFAAIPLLAALAPVRRALSDALEAEYAARLDAAAKAVEGEYRRLAGEAAASAAELARDEAVEQAVRDEVAGTPLSPAAAREWMTARGLDVLAIVDSAGRVLSSGHLPGRVGDVDPELKSLLETSESGTAAPRLVSRSTPAGVEPVLALLAWQPVAGGGKSVHLVAGRALGGEFASRVHSLTGADVAVVDARDARILARSAAGALRNLGLENVTGAASPRTRSIPVNPIAGAPALARIEVGLSAAGLGRATFTLVVAFLFAALIAVIAAGLLGAWLAGRITRPLEALRDGARRVAAGDLDGRVESNAKGEVGELVSAFNAMTGDLKTMTDRAASAERIAAWREVARRLAHEIKNPLTPISMSVDTLRSAFAQKRQDFPEIFEESAKAIQEEVARLKKIVDEFSRFARLPKPDLAPTAPADLCAAVLALYPEPPPGIRIERAVEAGLPTIKADRDQMIQVLLNLVRNGAEAMGAGGTLTVAARKDGGEVILEVKDTGPGIAPENLARVFEPYFTTKEGGTGLGLAIAERIVVEHGGRIEVLSKPGAGAVFQVHLPAA